MKGRVTAAIGIAAIVAVAAGGWFVARHLRAPVIPAVVVRTADANRLLSKSVEARIGRFVHDRSIGNRSGRPRLVALTFDDGPYPVETPLLLDELNDLHVPATFFLIGDDALKFPELTRDVSRDGDEIGNHTQTHPQFFNRLSPEAVTSELAEGAATLRRYSGDPSIERLMRPPHGRFTIRTVQAAQRAGYDVVLWNDDPGDYRAIAPATIVNHMTANASAPEIVLLHSGKLATIEALPDIVARYRAAGFTFVTAGELLARVPPKQILHPLKLRV